MNRNNLIKDLFSFSRKERIAAIALVLLILFVWFSPAFIRSFSTDKKEESDTSWIAAVKKLETDKDQDQDPDPDMNELTFQPNTDNHKTTASMELFYFDPNLLAEQDWLKLGVQAKTARTIQNYLSKGGQFRSPDDLKKIYGLKKEDVDRLVPFVRIENKKPGNRPEPGPKQNTYSASAKVIIINDINTADTSAFIALPGIGSKLANRIVNFRDKLGGFYSIDQVGEIYGLADSTFKRLRPYLNITALELKKHSINTATKEELRTHPYIKWNVANAIVEYREQHGNYTSLEELKNIALIEDPVFEKMKHYLVL